MVAHLRAIPTKIGHVHIPKTAGTSVNSWLDDLVSFERARPAVFPTRFAEFMRDHNVPVDVANELCSELSWKAYDIVHGHRDLIRAAPEGAFLFTFLRDPIQRAWSQYFDHSRLQEHDYAHLSKAFQRYHRAVRAHSFSQSLKTLRNEPVLREIYEDRQCRALVSWKYSLDAFHELSPRQRFEEAAEALTDKIDFAGIQEDVPRSMRALAAALGACPAQQVRHLNVVERRTKAGEDEAVANAILAEMNQADQMLYDFATERSQASLAAAESYDEEDFESHYAHARVTALAKIVGNTGLYTMNHPLIGTGFSGRDSAGTEECCRWTGPGTRSVIYLPFTGNRLRIFIRGWIDDAVRESFRLRVNGQPVDFSFEKQEGAEDVAVFQPSKGAAPYLKIEMEVARTFKDQELGRPGGDTRSKGASIWRIQY